MSTHRTTSSQLLTQTQKLQNKVKSLSDAREFYDPETGSSSGVTHVPIQPSTIPILMTMPCRDSGLPLDARNTMGTSKNVLESLLAREGPSSALFENSRNLASSSCGLGPGTTVNIVEHGRGVRQEPQSSSIPTSRFHQGVATLNPLSHTGGTYSHNFMMDHPLSELNFGEFPDSLEFQSWKVNFKTEVCTKSAYPHLTMHWIKEVEMVKLEDDPVTSRSITGRTDFRDYDMLDAMIASALKEVLTSVHFRKRASVEEQRAQKYDRFL